MKTFGIISLSLIVVALFTIIYSLGHATGYVKANKEHHRQIDSLVIRIQDNCSLSPASIVFPNGELLLLKNIDYRQPNASLYWENSINNTDNQEFVNEVAFNLQIDRDKVTQKQFNQRYLNN